MLLDNLSSTMSSTWPIFSPAEFLTLVPITFLARITWVCPDAVVMGMPPTGLNKEAIVVTARCQPHQRKALPPVRPTDPSGGLLCTKFKAAGAGSANWQQHWIG